MPAVARETVEFSAKVPAEQYKTFKENFPQYGAVQWFINESLASFNQQMADDPTAKERVNKAIESMLKNNREASDERTAE